MGVYAATDRASTITPMKANVIGVPAAYAMKLRSAKLKKALVELGIAFIAAALTLLALLNQIMPLVVVFLIATIVAGALFSQHRVELLRLRAGIRAERKVASALYGTQTLLIVHGATIGKNGDCDHIALGPWAAAIETKHGRAAFSFKNGKLQVGGRFLPRDPLAQARAQAAAVSRHTGVQMTPVVCISESPSRPVLFDGVWVCSASDLGSVLSSLPNRVGSVEPLMRFFPRY